jgi:hypothetical protein
VEGRIDDGNVRSPGKEVAVFAANALAEVEVGALCEWIAFSGFSYCFRSLGMVVRAVYIPSFAKARRMGTRGFVVGEW